jgi:hypothetical protein
MSIVDAILGASRENVDTDYPDEAMRSQAALCGPASDSMSRAIAAALFP